MSASATTTTAPYIPRDSAGNLLVITSLADYMDSFWKVATPGFIAPVANNVASLQSAQTTQQGVNSTTAATLASLQNSITALQSAIGSVQSQLTTISSLVPAKPGTNGQILEIVNGVPTYVNLANAVVTACTTAITPK